MLRSRKRASRGQSSHSRTYRLPALVLATSLAVGGSALATSGDGSTGSPTSTTPGERSERNGVIRENDPRPPLKSSGDAAWPERQRKALEDLKRADQARKSPEAKKERNESKTAHKDKSQAHAANVARAKHGKILAAPVWAPYELDSGERLGEYLGDSAVLIEHGEGKPKTMVESLLPLRAIDGDGKKRPVDLTLVEDEAVLVPRNPLVDVGISKRLRDGVLLEDIGVRVTPVAPADPQSPEMVEGKAFWGNAATDTDVVVAPRPSGIETFHVLRSEDSPEHLTLRFALPAGVQLVQNARDPETTDIRRGEHLLADITPPVSKDAQGAVVRTSHQIVGNTLVISVEHRGRDVAYPILVDPEVRENFEFWSTDPNRDFIGWSTLSNRNSEPMSWGAGTDSPGRGLHLFNDWSGQYYNVYDDPYTQNYDPIFYAEWQFRAPGQAHIYRARFQGYKFWAANATCNHVGIYGPVSYGYEISREQCGNAGGFWQYWWDLCPGDCSLNAGETGNVGIFGINMKDAGYRDAFRAYLPGASFYLSDRDDPVIVDDGTVQGWTNSSNAPIRFRTEDPGLGMKRFNLFVPGVSWDRAENYVDNCDGTRLRRCYNLTRHTTVGNLPEGVNPVQVDAWDIVDHSRSRTWDVKVDRTPPTPEPDIGENDEPPDDMGGVYVPSNSPYGLPVLASDPYSGVARIWVETAAGATLGTRTLSCTPECPRDVSTSISISAATAGLPEGAHSLVLKATDAAGNTASAPFRGYFDYTSPPQPTELRVLGYDPLTQSGDITWDAPEDPDLAGGQAPSGTESAEYRYLKAGVWTAWKETTEDSFRISMALPGEPIIVELRAIDSARNKGPIASATMLMVSSPADVPLLQTAGGTNTIEVETTAAFTGDALRPRVGTQVLLVDSSSRTYPSETDTNGIARYQDVQDGTYDLLIGYGPEERRTVTVRDGQTRRAVSTNNYDATDAEKAYCFRPDRAYYCDHFRDDSVKAAYFTERLFTEAEPGSEGSRANSFKHSFWVALMVNSISQKDLLDDDNYHYALEFADAHESESQDNLAERRESAIDQHNNSLGYVVGITNSPDRRGRKHNDTFFCNVIRNRNRRPRRVRFFRGSAAFRTSVGSWQPVWQWWLHKNTRRVVRLRPKSDFAGGQPCSP